MRQVAAAGLSLALALVPLGALAKALGTSPRPLPRPEAVAPEPMAALPAPLGLALIRPLPRPGQLQPAPGAEPEPIPSTPAANAQLAAIRPLPRPQAAVKAPKPGKSALPKGSVCGVPDILGKPIAAIPGKVQGCGLADGVEVTSISGIPFSQPLTIDCTTAKAMKTWIERGILPALGDRGGGVKRIEVYASYTCRPRNNQRGAKVSEHGRGRAIDFAGVTLQNGKVIDVLKGWKSEPKLLATLHRSACGPFGTVLGPKSDRFHLNHIHVDTARYRSGSYCR